MLVVAICLAVYTVCVVTSPEFKKLDGKNWVWMNLCGMMFWIAFGGQWQITLVLIVNNLFFRALALSAPQWLVKNQTSASVYEAGVWLFFSRQKNEDESNVELSSSKKYKIMKQSYALL